MSVDSSSMFDLANTPEGFIEDPYPHYNRLLSETPVLQQSDGSYLVSSYAALDRIYKDTRHFSSDKSEVFKPKFGDSPLYEHHTTSLVFNDPPLHTRIRKIIVGAMTPRAIAGLDDGLITIVDDLLDALPMHMEDGVVDLIEHFASMIPINIIGNLFAIPVSERGPLRDWSLSILGALEPVLTPAQLQRGNDAVVAFQHYLAELATERRSNPGNPDTDVLTRLLRGDEGTLTDSELLQNCIFILNAGHETTTNLIGNALGSLDEHLSARHELIASPALITTAVDEFLRFESPNQLGNRLTTAEVTIDGLRIRAGTNLHLMIGAANRDKTVFDRPQSLVLARKPNRHLAFAGGPHSCVGLNLARMEGRIAIGRFVERYPRYRIRRGTRSPRLRFRGFSQLLAELNPD